MQLHLTRFLSDNDTTLGILRLDGKVRAFTLEDEARAVKEAGETRIPAGTYEIKLRTVSPMAARYKLRFPWHRGMLWLQDVPGFTFIYIHIGNDDDDTAGCILVGNGARLDSMKLQASTPAYLDLYRRVVDAAEAGELEIHIEDRDI